MKNETPDEWYAKQGVEPPERVSHGLTDSEIKSRMQQFKAVSWHLEGNLLVGQGDMGRLVQRIPTDYVCKGMDDEGLPILEKVVLSN